KLFSFCLLLLILSSLVLSHVVLDALAVATYHPPNPLWNSVFWLSFHAFVFGMALFLLWKHRAALLFLLASVVPDVDWIARPLGLWTEGAAHDFFRSIPGLRLINDKLRAFLPDWRFVEMAALNELVLFAGVMLFASFFASIRAEQKLS